MLLKIKVHGPNEKPAHSCKCVVAKKQHYTTIMDYSATHDAWNCEDNDEHWQETAIGTENFVGWVYEDEIFWQMVMARREAGDEI